MNETRVVHLGFPALIAFSGPDAVRFLNGQLTQDVRRVAGGDLALPSCVTDAKGKLQFRVTLTAADDGTLWVEAPSEQEEALEMRLTRYLIADDVEVSDLTGEFALTHLLGGFPEAPAGVVARRSNRFGIPGMDWWLPVESEMQMPAEATLLAGDELEALRISNGVPAWGRELVEGMLPPEALLEETDISYNKGCYIGQEVISRIKSAGKVNRRLTRFTFPVEIPVVPGPLESGAGEVTSVSPIAGAGLRAALGYVKRGASDLIYKSPDGGMVPVRVV